MNFIRIVMVLVLAVVVLGCPASNQEEYRATIRRTEFGIPHISAGDLPSLGYGEGYAAAEDHFCSIMDQVVQARGERSRWFGRGENDQHLNSDIAVRAVKIHQRAAESHQTSEPEERDWIDGYAAGMNRFLADTGSQNLPGWCAGEPWVGPISSVDLVAYRRMLGLMAPRFDTLLATATPPVAGSATAAARGAVAGAEFDLDALLEERASNGWALGSERSAAGGGMLIANPHYPWVGSNRFWEKHLTLAGDFDAYGVSLLGSPGIAIGFNEAIAWTHTVSAGQRYTLYELDLVPGDPTSYFLDGEARPLRREEVSVDVLSEDGEVGTETHSVWFSHHGPILNWPGLGWTEEHAIAFRDANEDNDEGSATYLAMIRAGDMDSFQRAHDLQGILFVNTIATSAEGRAWYADVSATPMLSEETLAEWRESVNAGESAAKLYERGILLLDGSSSANDWVTDVRARDAGVVPFEEVPQLERRDYVFNANDSYWMAHREELLEGYSPAHGAERTARSLRTRRNAITLSDTSALGPAGEDGRFTLDELAAAALSNTSFAAQLLRPALVERCTATPRVQIDGDWVDLSAACEVLAGWNDRLDLDQPGAVLFREFITGYEGSDLEDAGELFAQGFDPQRAIETPAILREDDLALERLGRAVKVLEGAGFSVGSTLGELQYSNKRGGRIPIHGGQGGWEGVENVVRYGRNSTTLEPADPIGEPVAGSRYLMTSGYPINGGTSFLMALEFTAEGPNAQAFLTYSESGDPDSPHYVDQTERFSRKSWRSILFHEEDVSSGVVSEIVIRAPR